MPYLYQTVKAKCWECDPVTLKSKHICSKKEHACFRNIASFIKTPHKKKLKMAARGVRFLIQHVFIHACEIWDLSVAFSEIKSDFEVLGGPQSLEPGGHHTCKICGSQMVTPGHIVADANQAFEAIKLPALIHSLDTVSYTHLTLPTKRIV